MKHGSAPEEKCPLWFSLWAPLEDTPPIICTYSIIPLIITPPNNINMKNNSGGNWCFTINLDGSTISPLIKDSPKTMFGSIDSHNNPPNKNNNFGQQQNSYYQFRRRLDFPLKNNNLGNKQTCVINLAALLLTTYVLTRSIRKA